jgi:hypothetical protein
MMKPARGGVNTFCATIGPLCRADAYPIGPEDRPADLEDNKTFVRISLIHRVVPLR